MINTGPISIENALTFGKLDRFYHIIGHLEDEAMAQNWDESMEQRL